MGSAPAYPSNRLRSTSSGTPSAPNPMCSEAVKITPRSRFRRCLVCLRQDCDQTSRNSLADHHKLWVRRHGSSFLSNNVSSNLRTLSNSCRRILGRLRMTNGHCAVRVLPSALRLVCWRLLSKMQEVESCCLPVVLRPKDPVWS